MGFCLDCRGGASEKVKESLLKTKTALQVMNANAEFDSFLA